MSRRLIAVPVAAHKCLSEVAHVEAVFGGDMTHDAPLAAIRYPSVVALVYRLLGHGRPSAIPRSVWAAVVNSFNGVFRGRLGPHIRKECRITVQPLRADGDAAATITQVVPSASAFHASPTVILRRMGRRAYASGTVGACRSACALLVKAATTLRVSGPQVATKDNLGVAAIALTKPLAKPWFATGWRDNYQSIEPSVGDVNLSRHAVIVPQIHAFYAGVK